MSDQYEKLATRARELLGVYPRPATEDVARDMLTEIAREFEVAERLRERFVERLLPALVHIVSSSRSKLVRELEEEAARAHLARRIGPGAESPARAVAEPTSIAPASALGPGDGHPHDGTRDAPAVLVPEPERTDCDHDDREDHDAAVAPSAPELAIGDAESRRESPAPGDGLAKQPSEPSSATPPVTPLSQRYEVLPGYRALRDELLYVPDFEGVTYGSATAQQRQRAMTYYHSVASGYLDKARRLRLMDEWIKAQGAATLNEALDDRALAEAEP